MNKLASYSYTPRPTLPWPPVSFLQKQAFQAEQRRLFAAEDDYFGWYFSCYASLEIQHEIFFHCLERGASE